MAGFEAARFHGLGGIGFVPFAGPEETEGIGRFVGSFARGGSIDAEGAWGVRGKFGVGVGEDEGSGVAAGLEDGGSAVGVEGGDLIGPQFGDLKSGGFAMEVVGTWQGQGDGHQDESGGSHDFRSAAFGMPGLG